MHKMFAHVKLKCSSFSNSNVCFCILSVRHSYKISFLSSAVTLHFMILLLFFPLFTEKKNYFVCFFVFFLPIIWQHNLFELTCVHCTIFVLFSINTKNNWLAKKAKIGIFIAFMRAAFLFHCDAGVAVVVCTSQWQWNKLVWKWITISCFMFLFCIC